LRVQDGEVNSENNNLQPLADVLFNYLRDAIYQPARASLDVERLPAEFQNFGKGLVCYTQMVTGAKELAKELASGDLNAPLPPPCNEIAAPLKSLHASLKHLTWQSQQVAKGDYQQHVDFMGDFSRAFNDMIQQLRERQDVMLGEKSKLERYVELLLANSPDPILIFDRQGRLAYMSDSFLRIQGLTSAVGVAGHKAEELLSAFVPAEERDVFRGLFADALAGRQTVRKNWKVDTGHANSPRHYAMQVSPMLAQGRVDGALILLHDTTDVMRAKELAEQMSLAKSDFLARMSHEMRTPMNAIIGMSAIYGSTDDWRRKDDCVSKISDASNHLLGVINDILDMSKIEADKFELYEDRFAFQTLIAQATGVMLYRMAERKLEFAQELGGGIPREMIADKQRLAQVLTNLLSNAVKFTPEGGSVTLSSEKIRENEDVCWLRFQVADTGIGIGKEEQKRVFQSFEQVDGGMSRRFDGTGLGLAISRRIVEMMGGTIWVESELGKGARFIFEVPLKKVPEGCRKTEPEEDVAVASSVGIFAGKRVLLAEDIDINREILLALLEHTAVELIPVADGREAFDMFAASPEKFDMILMDIHMPRMDGYEATKHIRSSGLPGADTVPIIAMTANVFREDVEKCLQAGMNGHLGKPVVVNEVIRKMREWMPEVEK